MNSLREMVKRKLKPVYYLFLPFMLACVILVVAPVIIGIEVEKRYQVLNEQAQQIGMRLLEHSFIRNWFRSEAQTEFVFNFPITDRKGIDQSEIRLYLQSKIAHGPLIKRGQIRLADISTKIFFADHNSPSRNNPAIFHTLFNLNGAGRTIIGIPTLEITAENRRQKVYIGSLTGEINYTAGMSSIRINGGLRDLTVAHGLESKLALGLLSVDVEKWLGTTGLPLGMGKLSLRDLDVNERGGILSMEIDQIDFTFESSETANRAAFKVMSTLGRVDLPSAEYGPGKIALAVDKLPVPALIKFQQAMTMLHRQLLSREQQRMAMMNLLLAHSAGLLIDDPWFAVEALHLETPQGEISGKLRIQARGINWLDMIRGSWVKKLSGDASLRMPEPIFKQFLQMLAQQRINYRSALLLEYAEEELASKSEDPMTITESKSRHQFESFLNLGLIQRDTDDIIIVATLSDGILMLNGRKVAVY